jgi:hypothetical protein
MKYAVLGPRGAINRVSETEPQNVPEQATVVEITDEQFDQVQEGRTATPPVRYGLKDGELMELRAFLEATRPRQTVSAEKWLTQKLAPSADIGVRLVGLQNLELGLVQAGKTSSKLSAMRSWINGIMATYAQDQSARNDWPEPPHSFEETFVEALAVLSAE